MTIKKFKTGDVVVLKSGSPKMTVDFYINLGMGVVSDNVICKWFVDTTLMTGEFNQDSLVCITNILALTKMCQHRF